MLGLAMTKLERGLPTDDIFDPEVITLKIQIEYPIITKHTPFYTLSYPQAGGSENGGQMRAMALRVNFPLIFVYFSSRKSKSPSGLRRKNIMNLVVAKR